MASRWYKRLSVVVLSSPVPSNPQNIHALDDLFTSLEIVTHLNRANKIIQLDAPNPNLPKHRIDAYKQFETAVRLRAQSHTAYSDTIVNMAEIFQFHAHNLAAAIRVVETKFVLVLQHDFILVKPFDAFNLLRTMDELPIVKHVRLNARANVERGFDGVIANFTHGRVPLARTCGWSDGPHVSTKAYYKKFVIPLNLKDHCQGRRKFMEESVHYRMQRLGRDGGCWALKKSVADGATRSSLKWPDDFNDYGTYLYGYADVDGSYTRHKTLRGNVSQWGREFKESARGGAGLGLRPSAVDCRRLRF